jgi:hypothetical protein
MDFARKLLATEPVRAIMSAVGLAIGGALYAFLPDDLKIFALPVAGGIIGGGEAARLKAVPQAKAAKAAGMAARLAVERVTPEQVADDETIPPPTKPVVENAVRDALVNVGIAKGTQVAERLVRRWNPFD